MSERPRRHPIGLSLSAHIRSNLVAYLALFVALGGTGAWAADKITSKEIAKNAVRSKHIARSAVKSPEIAAGAVTAEKLANGLSWSADCNEGLASNDVMVRVGPVCIDKYEASIWTAKTGGTQITGAIPCDANGQDCQGQIFARSVPGVAPRVSITWFQAQQALANSGKRLATNAEWQMAVAGTPDSTACNVSTGAVQNTGANADCVSDWGTHDMVGNVWEWVADWDEDADSCLFWPADYGSDFTCFGDGTPNRFPGALRRGGAFENGADAGPFAVSANSQPSLSDDGIGFRGAR